MNLNENLDLVDFIIFRQLAFIFRAYDGNVRGYLDKNDIRFGMSNIEGPIPFDNNQKMAIQEVFYINIAFICYFKN